MLPDRVARLKPELEKARTSLEVSFTASQGFYWVTNQIKNGGFKSRITTATKECDATDFTSVLRKM